MGGKLLGIDTWRVHINYLFKIQVPDWQVGLSYQFKDWQL